MTNPWLLPSRARNTSSESNWRTTCAILPFTHKTNHTKVFPNLNPLSRRVPRLFIITLLTNFFSRYTFKAINLQSRRLWCVSKATFLILSILLLKILDPKNTLISAQKWAGSKYQISVSDVYMCLYAGFSQQQRFIGISCGFWQALAYFSFARLHQSDPTGMHYIEKQPLERGNTHYSRNLKIVKHFITKLSDPYKTWKVHSNFMNVHI